MARSPRAKPKAEKSPAKKGGGKAAGRGGRAGVKPKRRDYAAEYRRRVARAEALGMSRSVGRGHPREKKGEIGMDDLRMLRDAVEELSPGEQRRAGRKGRLRSNPDRVWARETILRMLGLGPGLKEKRRGPLTDKFSTLFQQLGLGTSHQAYTLFYSP